MPHVAHVGKVLPKIVALRLGSYLERERLLPESQCGFRPGRSTVDMIFVVRLLQELWRKEGVPLYTCFVDLQKAYESVDRSLLWVVLARFGVPPVMVDIVRQFHDEMRLCVRLGGGCRNDLRSARVFPRGVFLSRYCSTCSSQRFLILPRRNSEQTPRSKPLFSIRSTPLGVRDGDETPGTSTTWKILYADDATIVCRSLASLANIIIAVVEVSGAYGLTVAERKTETMIMRPPHHAQEGLKIVTVSQRYAQTEQFVYLGGHITAEADAIAEIRRRTGTAWSTLHRYANVVYDRPTTTMPMALKVRMLEAEVREALLYGCSTWTLLT